MFSLLPRSLCDSYKCFRTKPAVMWFEAKGFRVASQMASTIAFERRCSFRSHSNRFNVLVGKNDNDVHITHNERFCLVSPFWEPLVVGTCKSVNVSAKLLEYEFVTLNHYDSLRNYAMIHILHQIITILQQFTISYQQLYQLYRYIHLALWSCIKNNIKSS